MRIPLTTLRALSLLCGLALAFGSAAFADDLTAGQMIQQLQPKKALTRSLKATAPKATPEDEQFVEGLQSTTRSIVVEDRQKLSEIVHKYDMPKLDLEIYFDFNSSTISSAALPTLIKLGQTLSDPSLNRQRIIISGHTDAVGSDTDNQELSEARARSVRDFLIQNFQMDGSRLIAVGFGEEELKNGADPEAAENRRVTVVNVVM